MLVKCTSCRGAKKLMGLGAIMSDCKKCNGAGAVQQDGIKKADIKEDIVEKSISEEVKKKRGRKPKMILIENGND